MQGAIMLGCSKTTRKDNGGNCTRPGNDAIVDDNTHSRVGEETSEYWNNTKDDARINRPWKDLF